MNNTNKQFHSDLDYIENGKIYTILKGSVMLDRTGLALENVKVRATESINLPDFIGFEILEESKDIVNVAIDTAQWSREADYLKEFLWDELKGKMDFVRDDLEELTVQNGVIYIEFHDVGDWFYLKPHTSLSK